MGNQEAVLRNALQGGRFIVGQILGFQSDGGAFELRHHADADVSPDSLELHERVEDARILAKVAESGAYRALKTGNDLRRGWLLRLPTLDEVVAALNHFYPAALGQWAARQTGSLRVVPLRDTLERQTGMYRFARCISDDGIERIVRERCRASCLRAILWPEGDEEASSLGNEPGKIPLVCSEACNLLVSDARRVSKEEAEQASSLPTSE